MTIKITKTTEKNIDIKLPFFRRDPDSMGVSLFAVLDENTAINLYRSDHRTCIENDEIKDRGWIEKNVAERFQTWEPITEQEFMTAYSDALKSLSLEPVMA